MNRFPLRVVPPFLIIAALAAPAAAKVAFTGYGNVIATGAGQFRVRGPSSVLGATPEGNLISRGFRLDALGLFATTRVSEHADFVADLTFRNVGTTVGQTRVQYAYLDARLPWHDLSVQLGKVTLPFGYYNARRFYPFQRVELSAPVWVNGILGLPIADAGAVLGRRFELDGWSLDARVYGVNGYGPQPTSTAVFRNPSIPGGTAISGNLGAANANQDVAVGGQLAAVREGLGEVGVSYYRGDWDRDGHKPLQLAGAHARWTPGKAELLVEYLHLRAKGDQGMASLFGSEDWGTNGAFATVSHPLFAVSGRTIDGWAHGELYHSDRSDASGPHELLRSVSGGLSSRVNENLLVRLEALWLYYSLPTDPLTQLEGTLYQAAAVVTF